MGFHMLAQFPLSDVAFFADPTLVWQLVVRSMSFQHVIFQVPGLNHFAADFAGFGREPTVL